MMMNIGARGHDFKTVHSPAKLGKRFKNKGFNIIQLSLPASFPDMPSEAKDITMGMGKYFKDSLAEYGVEIAILSCYVNIIHPDKQIRKENLEKFCSYVRFAKYFGAAMVVTETGNVQSEITYTKDNFTEEAFQDCVESVSIMAEAAEKAGIHIGIEPGLNHPIYSPVVMKKLLDQVDSPNVVVVLDPTNLIDSDTHKTQAELFQQSFDLFGKDIVAVHLKDFTVADDQLQIAPIGKGIMDFKSILKIIKKESPFLHIITEETKEEELDSAMLYLKDIQKNI